VESASPHLHGFAFQVDTVYTEGAEEGKDPLGDMFSSPGTSTAARMAAGCVTEVRRGVFPRASIPLAVILHEINTTVSWSHDVAKFPHLLCLI
jgi:hypothetical protein